MYSALLQEIAQLSPHQKSAITRIYRNFSDNEAVASSDYQHLCQGFDYVQQAEGLIIACFGCDLRPTPHHIQWQSALAYGWCIWDAFFITQLVGKPAVIHSTDPILHQALRIDYHGQGFAVEPIWFTFPMKTAGDNSDLRSCFCQRVHGFVSVESANRYAKEHHSEVVDYDTMLHRTQAMVDALQNSVDKASTQGAVKTTVV